MDNKAILTKPHESIVGPKIRFYHKELMNISLNSIKLKLIFMIKVLL